MKKKHFFSRIRAKMFASLFLILLIFFAIICIVSRPVLTTVLIYRTGQNLENIANEIDSLTPGSSTYYFDLYSISVNNNVTFEMTDPSGILSYRSSDGYSAQSSVHIYSSNAVASEFSQTEKSASYSSPDESATFEERHKIASSAEYLVYSTVISTNETLHIYSPVSIITDNVNLSTTVFAVICIITAIVMLAFVYIYVSGFTKPLEEMSDITKDMASLNFARKCADYGSDEIGELGSNINSLSTALDSTLLDLKNKNIQLENDIEHRREFISNVSHELKTPIAIISGYAEGLSAGISDDPAVIHEYCDIINEESKKMNGLVVELLELSKYESISNELSCTDYNLSEQIKEVSSHFSLIFSSHSIEFSNKTGDNIFCFADKDKIEIVLKNYISNAVSHCKGEMKIEINVLDSGNNLTIKVFNTGDNIKEEDVERIWESFYRGDKAHSRNENRFGLGLSIVKAIADSHGTKCAVRNCENGVEFTFMVSKSNAEV